MADKLEQKHQSPFVDDYTARGITTKNEGQQVTFEWLCDQVQRGEDVELSWAYSGGGAHIVRVFGCGKTRGAAWVRYLHDRTQTHQRDPTDRLGLESKQGWLGHLDDDDRLNMDSVNTNLLEAVSESLKPEIKQQPGAPPLTFGAALVNGASFAARNLGPGALLSAFGLFPDTANAELRSEDASQSINLPTTLNGLTVRINGIAAPLFFAGPTQVNFQLPYEIQPGQATVEVVQSGKSSGFFTVPVGEAGPGIFPLDASIAGPGRGVIQNQDFSLNIPGSGAAPGEAIVVYVSGLGEVDNPVPSGQAAPTSPLSRALAGGSDGHDRRCRRDGSV